MTQVWPFWGLAPVPTVVSVNFRPVSVVMVFPCVCAAAGQVAARVAAAIMKRRVRGIGGFSSERAYHPATRHNGAQTEAARAAPHGLRAATELGAQEAARQAADGDHGDTGRARRRGGLLRQVTA